jgi:ribosomal protein S18 acetylase RimI-like enzyme
MELEFIPGTESHMDNLLTMMADFYAIDDYPFDKSLTEFNLRQFILNKDLGEIWIISKSEKMIGYLVLTFGFSFEYGGRDAFIDELYLVADHRHKGIGKKAMAFIEQRAIIRGVKVVHLEVERHNQNGLKLYKKMGYNDNGRTLLSKKVVLS